MRAAVTRASILREAAAVDDAGSPLTPRVSLAARIGGDRERPKVASGRSIAVDRAPEAPKTRFISHQPMRW
jgi:hypothetical protein